MIRIAVIIGVLEVIFVAGTVGATGVGVMVGGKRGSNVMVGTGDERATCTVAMRSCGFPVAGISLMICFKMFSLMTGTEKSYGSPL
jgi:hypothetical protein